jgi:methylated-DNA-[protein]-cysteine S-methyltransferase
MEAGKSEVYIGQIPGSPLGEIWVAVSENRLAAVEIGVHREEFLERLRRMGYRTTIPDTQSTAEPLRQISDYLAGALKTFDLPIDWSRMTPFQEGVLRETLAIPYGETRTYGVIAESLGRPQAARAVGRAEATNPIPLVIPCHRVIGSDGGLHGYGTPGGVETKAWLLNLEKGGNLGG